MTSLVCAATLLASDRLHRRSRSAMRWGAGGLACLGLAMLGIALRGLVPDFVSYTIANALGPAGVIVLYESSRRLCHARPRAWVVGLAVAAVFAFQLWLGDSPGHYRTRLLATSVVQGTFCALTVPLFVRRLRKDPPLPVLFAIGLAVLILVSHAARSASILIFGVSTDSAGQYAAGGLQAVVVAMFTLAPVVHAMILLSWVNGRIAAELRKAATTDDLTGLASRRHLFALARRMLAAGGPSQTTGLLMIDLDFFKQVNDRFGHRVGDRVLAHFAATLRRALRPDDEAGRYGGEEFCALVRRADEQQVHATARAICEAVRADPFEHEGQVIPLTVSIGVATTHGEDRIDRLLLAADRHVYLAKALGRDRVADRYTPRPAQFRRADDLPSQRPPQPPTAGRASTEPDTQPAGIIATV